MPEVALLPYEAPAVKKRYSGFHYVVLDNLLCGFDVKTLAVGAVNEKLCAGDSLGCPYA
jgi:hypothetical protein